MQIQICVVNIDTGDNEDLVLLAPQITGTIRACLPAMGDHRPGTNGKTLAIAAPAPAVPKPAMDQAAAAAPAPVETAAVTGGGTGVHRVRPAPAHEEERAMP